MVIWRHSESERRNPLPPLGYSFQIAATVLLYASSHKQDNTYHGLCYTSRGALAETRNSSMGPPLRIDRTTHRTMSERSYHWATYCETCHVLDLHIELYMHCQYLLCNVCKKSVGVKRWQQLEVLEFALKRDLFLFWGQEDLLLANFCTGLSFLCYTEDKRNARIKNKLLISVCA